MANTEPGQGQDAPPPGRLDAILPDAVDIIVAGSGVAGLSAALFGAIRGFDVLVCEKSALIGGTSAYSGGSVWIPGAAAGQRDDVASAARYLDAEIGDDDPDGRRRAFLASGAAAIACLSANSDVRFKVPPVYPDYHPASPGASTGGRVLQPEPFDGRLLGEEFPRLRPPRPGFTILGGMMVSREEARLLVRPFSSWKSFAFALRALAGHARARLRHRRGTRLLLGNALVARLLYSLRRRGVGVRTEAALASLVLDDGRVTGATFRLRDGVHTVRARRGVVIATGGFAFAQDLRQALQGEPGIAHVLAAEGATGDGIQQARKAGAAVDDRQVSGGHFMPVSVLAQHNDRVIFPHVIMDRARPGLIAVDRAGRRFVNEADSYHDFVLAMMARTGSATDPAFLICDSRFLRDYGLGLVKPRWRILRRFVAAGYLRTAPTLAALAQAIGVDQQGLAASVAAHNDAAATGIDAEFGKGSNPLNRFNGDPGVSPNPCLGPIHEPPFYAIAVQPAVIGTTAGIATDGDARALGANGHPIEGLYVCGADQSSLMRGTYPGPGINLGPAIVFAYRAVEAMAAGRRETEPAAGGRPRFDDQPA